jgi:virginiamycin B lyase
MVNSATYQATAAVAGTGFIFYSGAAVTPFEVITLPTVTSRPRQPHSVAAITHPVTREIWYTDPGADRVGQLIYTATNNYAFTEFPLAAGAEPFDLVVDDGSVWFTAKNGDWIGQIELGTQVVISYPVPANSEPWNIDAGSDNSLWFTERAANKIGRLIVTDTANYSLIEYQIPPTDSRPEAIAVQQRTPVDRIWFGQTSPTGQNRVIWLNLAQLPPNNFELLGPLSEPSYPKNMAIGTDLWFTELAGNRVSRVFVSTLTNYRRETVPTPGSQPYDLVVGPGEVIWFTELAAQQVGRLTNPGGSVQITEYPVAPQAGRLWLQGIDLDDAGRLWVAGFAPEQQFLPAVFKQ